MQWSPQRQEANTTHVCMYAPVRQLDLPQSLRVVPTNDPSHNHNVIVGADALGKPSTRHHPLHQMNAIYRWPNAATERSGIAPVCVCVFAVHCAAIQCATGAAMQ